MQTQHPHCSSGLLARTPQDALHPSIASMLASGPVVRSGRLCKRAPTQHGGQPHSQSDSVLDPSPVHVYNYPPPLALSSARSTAHLFLTCSALCNQMHTHGDDERAASPSALPQCPNGRRKYERTLHGLEQVRMLLKRAWSRASKSALLHSCAPSSLHLQSALQDRPIAGQIRTSAACSAAIFSTLSQSDRRSRPLLTLRHHVSAALESSSAWPLGGASASQWQASETVTNV